MCVFNAGLNGIDSIARIGFTYNMPCLIELHHISTYGQHIVYVYMPLTFVNYYRCVFVFCSRAGGRACADSVQTVCLVIAFQYGSVSTCFSSLSHGGFFVLPNESGYLM